MLFSAITHTVFHMLSLLGLPGTTLHNPCSPIYVAVGSLQSTQFKSGNLLWSWCNSRPDSWHKSQLSSTDPDAWLQPQALPVGLINWYRLLIVFNVHPYLNHSGMKLSRREKKKRGIKNFLSHYWSQKIAQYHYFYPSHLSMVTFSSCYVQGVWHVINSEITYSKAQALFLFLHPVQFLSC